MSIGWPVNTLGDANWWFWTVFPSTSRSWYSFIRAFLFPLCTRVCMYHSLWTHGFCVLCIQCITMIAILFNILMVPNLATVSPFEWTAVFLWHDPIVFEHFPAQRWCPSWLWTFPAQNGNGYFTEDRIWELFTHHLPWWSLLVNPYGSALVFLTIA